MKSLMASLTKRLKIKQDVFAEQVVSPMMGLQAIAIAALAASESIDALSLRGRLLPVCAFVVGITQAVRHADSTIESTVNVNRNAFDLAGVNHMPVNAKLPNRSLPALEFVFDLFTGAPSPPD